jgi:hypothetical protein
MVKNCWGIDDKRDERPALANGGDGTAPWWIWLSNADHIAWTNARRYRNLANIYTSGYFDAKAAAYEAAWERRKKVIRVLRRLHKRLRAASLSCRKDNGRLSK